MSREIEIERFQAQGDDEKEYTIVIVQEVKPAGSLENPNATVRGMKRVLLIDGTQLTAGEGGAFQTPGGGLKLTRI